MLLWNRVQSFVAGRLATNSWLGLGLTLTVLVSMAAIALFASLLDAVLDNATLVRLDVASAAFVHARVTASGLAVMAWTSRTGSPASMSVLAVAGGLELLRRQRPRLFVVWVAAFAGGGLLDRTLKAVVHRHRPVFAATSLSPSLSFPSGHAMMSFVGCAMLVYALIVLGLVSGTRRNVIVLLAAFFVFLVGVSRVYLSAHYPSDVLGGWTAAAAWVAACVGLAETWRSRLLSASS